MNFIKKWYTYQKERFPVLVYGLYVFCIVFATACFTYSINDVWAVEKVENIYMYECVYVPPFMQINYFKLIPMFIVAFLQFFMVRIVDEFKDYEEDCKYRPYRPVPRGLIKLKELKVVFIICAILQFGITYYINKSNVIFLIIMWIFFALMSKGFFIKNILDKNILYEVLLDEIMLPILVIYLSKFVFGYPIASWMDWIPFLLTSYFISWIVEIARKLRCKEDEEDGVKTYTAVFGIPKATILLLILETFVMILNVMILKKYYAIIAFGLVSIVDIKFIKKQDKKSAKMAEAMANVFIILAYISMFLLI